MLSFTKGRPIARILGGEYDGKILHLDEEIDGKNEGISINPLNLLNDDFFRKRPKRAKLIQIEKVKRAIKMNKIPMDDDEVEEMYIEANNLINSKKNKEIMINDGSMVPLPNIEKKERLYVAGPSDSGKSTYAAGYIREFKRHFKKREFYIFSRVQEDIVLDKLKPLRIVINEELVENPIDPSELGKSLVLFDDIDTIKEKDIRETVQHLRDDLLETGRHEDIYTISTSHLLMDYKKTRTLLNEATSVTFFPQSGSSYHIKRFLKEYCGLDQKMIKTILVLPSRWVTVYKTYPMYILYEKGCFLLNK